jgi:hypothetical protein
MGGANMDPVDTEERFREQNGDELTGLILLRTSQLFDYPFWLRLQTACHDYPEIAWEVAWNERSQPAA